ncbi:Motile sperm domain-containing protein 2-like protein [Dinothrombium tinctorium]|uniref:Motile sperm domain-containing protein 2-like protein n=1 Tax=Dinothrombium tinctorium TaxID=1965070 RepID=A0A3S4REK3_9ACAR|nr:Motile sperm domain-containing protein 2-like protein [Dinothrombium tinctorium]
MPKAERVEFSNRSAPLVKYVRERFLEEYIKHPNQFDARDVEKIKNDDWFVKRFVLARNRNKKKALTMMIESMKWRKAENFYDLKPSAFPEGMFRLGVLFPYENDKEGNSTIYIRIKFFTRIPELTEISKQYFCYILFQALERVEDGKDVTAIIDFKDAGPKNCDFGFVLFIFSKLTKYFPFLKGNFIVVDLTAIFYALWIVLKNMLPSSYSRKFKFVNRETIGEYVETENLPDFLGGTCRRPHRGDEMVPEGCLNNFDFLFQNGLSPKRIDEILNLFQPMFDCDD